MRKTIKRAAAFAVSASLAGAFSVAQSTFAADETVLNVAISTDPSSLDPAINIGDSLMYILGLTEESLTRYGEDQQIVDGLADEITHNDDYTQWTFHLRDSSLAFLIS